MLTAMLQVVLYVGMGLSFFGTIGLGNGALWLLSGGRAHWRWHVALWVGSLLALSLDAYYGAELGMWQLFNYVPTSAAGRCS